MTNITHKETSRIIFSLLNKKLDHNIEKHYSLILLDIKNKNLVLKALESLSDEDFLKITRILEKYQQEYGITRKKLFMTVLTEVLRDSVKKKKQKRQEISIAVKQAKEIVREKVFLKHLSATVRVVYNNDFTIKVGKILEKQPKELYCVYGFCKKHKTNNEDGMKKEKTKKVFVA